MAKAKSKSNSGPMWQGKRINSEKAFVKKRLDEEGASSGLKSRLQFAVSWLRDLQREAPTPEGNLRQYVIAVSALVHHERHGGLRPAEIKTLAKIAKGILAAEGISPVSSRLAYLHGELHLVLSQIRRRAGEHFEAAWEQQMSVQVAPRALSGGAEFQKLAHALRLLRLGHFRPAWEILSEITSQSERSNNHVRAQLQLLKLCRYMRKKEALEELNRELLSHSEKEIQLEAQWEEWARQSTADGDVSRLVLATLKGKPHHQADYLVEAFLWSRTSNSREWLKRFPKIQRLARNPKIVFKDLGFFYEFARTIENCYDFDYPFVYRLDQLGKYLARLNRVTTMEREILLLGASLRWLFRSQAWGFAQLIMEKYRDTCKRVSDGKTDDCLGLLGDVFQRLEEKNHAKAA